MKSISDLISELKTNNRCDIFSAKSRLQSLSDNGLAYPDDLIEFYSLCQGLSLFKQGKDNISFKILPPEEILPANIIILGEACAYDLSSSWYVICKTDNGDYLSIDLSKERNGQCYDSHHEIHGVAGSCPVIAKSFTELLNELYKTNGKDIYWNKNNYGDAYAEI
ncbi:SMI1/KNR4 family protein [Brenneria sp. 4F2]|nr:SMI1/KNR4 family protein [Brenneria bubanii]